MIRPAPGAALRAAAVSSSVYISDTGEDGELLLTIAALKKHRLYTQLTLRIHVYSYLPRDNVGMT